MIRGIAAWLLAMMLSASAAHAHGGVGMQDNRCVLRIGPDIMFFTGYQPQNSRDEFRDDIPTTGQTVVALDMQDNELRDMLTEIRIIKDEGNHTTMNGLPFLTDAELRSPQVLDPVLPKTYPTGTLTFQHTFPENGKFIGIVTVKNAHGQTYCRSSRFQWAKRLPKRRNLCLDGRSLLALAFGPEAKTHCPEKVGVRDSRMAHGWPICGNPPQL